MVVYFNIIALCGLLLSVIYWDTQRIGELLLWVTSVFLLGMLWLGSYLYLTVHKEQNKYIRNLTEKKKTVLLKETQLAKEPNNMGGNYP